MSSSCRCRAVCCRWRVEIAIKKAKSKARVLHWVVSFLTQTPTGIPSVEAGLAGWLNKTEPARRSCVCDRDWVQIQKLSLAVI